MALTWHDQLKNELIQLVGENQGSALYEKYEAALSAGYTGDHDPHLAATDIQHLEQLSAENPLGIQLYIAPDRDIPLHLRLFQQEQPRALSNVLPMLENFDLRTESEHPYKLTLENGEHRWISDFAINYNGGTFDLAKATPLFQEALAHIYFEHVENDGFNKLILGAYLSWREVMILRTYGKYLRQIGFRFSQSYIEKALVNHADCARDLVDLFIAIHQPGQKSNQAAAIETKILQALENVTSLDEDKIIRRLLELIKATLRTNYFQTINGKPKEYLAIKLNSRTISDMPLPIPLYEIFVYSPRVEGIHLRYAKVARGGLRWSDRPEDFRTEILGLMKAQVVKNAVIVPSGAKGGFVLKSLPPQATKEDRQKEGIACYSTFIRGLLDLTDNIVDDKNIPPRDVVCLDEADPYLVVAADKGTATFSDLANSIAREYAFWLGDAFASGGSAGYDHKKMGITARGAWESIKRHFREINLDISQHTITVVGIGDMSGDVFGNGMLYSRHIKLVAAFDHRHIFIDPNPNPDISYEERLRLSQLAGSSWEDYNPELISTGGGVFKRSLKSITLTPEMQTILGVTATTLTPNDLVKAILRAPVDLLFNGGIGTYVKAHTESQTEVGDRSNDYCRVNGDELRCRVVGEGGNLGFTQRGRIEYALTGGLINTDFIDNSAGVDCSDHEVNLKILLNQEVQQGRLTEVKRNELLAAMTDEVAQLVLKDNSEQALVMSFSAFHANKNLSLHANFIKELESIGLLNRQVEFLPDEKQLLERKAANLGLTRPELAVLLAYSKISIKQAILNSTLPEDPYISQIMSTAFPASIRTTYHQALKKHRLYRDIVATQLSNEIVNDMGFTFVYRLQVETGATLADIIRAYTVASQVFDSNKLKKLIVSLDFKISLPDQYTMLYHIRSLINIATRWFLHSNHLKGDLGKLIEHFASRIKQLEKYIPTLMGGATREYLDSLSRRFEAAGLSKDLAHHIATYRAIYTGLNIIEVATNNHFDLLKTAQVYFSAGERINLLWFRDQIANDSREGHWNALARLTLRDELDLSQRTLTVAIMNNNKNENDANKLIEYWATQNQHALERWNRLLALVHSSGTIDYTMFFIAIRELVGLIMTSQ